MNSETKPMVSAEERKALREWAMSYLRRPELYDSSVLPPIRAIVATLDVLEAAEARANMAEDRVKSLEVFSKSLEARVEKAEAERDERTKMVTMLKGYIQQTELPAVDAFVKAADERDALREQVERFREALELVRRNPNAAATWIGKVEAALSSSPVPATPKGGGK